MREKKAIKYILPAVIILAGFFSYFLNYDRILLFDWGFFNSFGHLLKSAVLEYHRFPVHDPWVCGGVDILSRPQNWVFSPFIITTLLLPPYIANLLSLIIMSFIGFWGMYRLLRYYEVSGTVSIYCALLFINSSWFGLHITEGHVVFRTLFLLPLLIYLVLTLTSVKRFFALTLLMAYFLLDGGIYAFFYSVIVMFFLLILNMVPVKTLLSDIRNNAWTFALTVAAFLLVSSVKIVPVLLNTIVKPRSDQYHMTLREIAISLFYPLQSVLHLRIWTRNDLRFHEFGCYIGILSFLIICWYARKKGFWKRNLKEIFIIGFFFWLATGFGGVINPGTLLKEIPILNKTHFETRYFIIFMVFYIIVLARVIDRNISSRLLLIIILTLLTMEFLFVRNFSAYEVFQYEYSKKEFPAYINKRRITDTLEYVEKPQVYWYDNIASKDCYEAIIVPTHVRHISEPGYRGETYTGKGSGIVEVLEFSPGFINAEYDLERPDTVFFNTNSNGSWVVNKPHEIVENPRNLLSVSVKEGKGVLNLHYRPGYLKYIIVFYVLGVIIYLLVAARMYFKK